MVENVSTHKTRIKVTDVNSFLSSIYPEAVTNLQMISGGEGSQAFSFEVNGESFVIRINKHTDNGFKKDKYAYDNFSSPQIPIPEVTKIGKMENGFYYCFSKACKGNTLDKYSKEENIEMLEDIFATLDAIHGVDITHTSGYGNLNAEGQAEEEIWSGFLLGVNKWANKMFEEKNPILERDVWDKIFTRFLDLVPFCPEERYLIHADFGFDNLIAQDGKITGVIDWENSKYGDFVFDISWLTFWSTDEERNKRLKDRYKDVPNFSERLLCYELYIGLGSLSFYAYSNQKDKYEFVKGKLLELIK